MTENVAAINHFRTKVKNMLKYEAVLKFFMTVVATIKSNPGGRGMFSKKYV